MFRRVTQAPDIVLSSHPQTPTTYWSYAFKLNDLPNYQEFQSLYDLFRVNKVKVTIVPNFTGLDGGSIPLGAQDLLGVQGTNSYWWFSGMPNIHSVIDYDSISLVDNLPDLMQYSTYRMTRGNRMHSRYWTPAVIMGTESECDPDGTVARTPTMQKFKPWLDTATGHCVPHYGMKLAIDRGPTTIFGSGPSEGSQQSVQEVRLRVYVTAYIECKGVR